jgi:hypothetical protein
MSDIIEIRQVVSDVKQENGFTRLRYYATCQVTYTPTATNESSAQAKLLYVDICQFICD